MIDIFTASSSIFGSLIAGKSRHEESDKDKEKAFLAILSKAADVALDVALLTLDSEEEDSFTLVTEFMEATVEKRKSSSLQNKQLTSKFGGFTLPECEQENGTRIRFVKFLSSMVNTHLFESPDVLQGSPVVSLEINDEDGVPSPLDGIYTINIAKTDVMAARNNMTARASKLNISETAPLEFSFNIIQPGSVVSLTLESTDSSALYGVYIQEGSMANETMHDCGWTIPGKPAQTVTYNATNIGTYYVMVKLERHGTHSDVHGILIYVSVNICRFWDDTKEEWQTEGCWPDKSDNVAVLTCKCNHLPSVKPTN
ncbi:uncharacterized protein [Ptychodera flava]|uniref:uncharacterized protein n=1 Tax=Ptychodera flava TaxID=63121 RepID=UPI00396A13F2